MKHRHRNAAPRWRAGFSMIELMVAITLVGILLAIGLPAFQDVRVGTLLSAGQQDVRATLLRARWMAINSGQSRTVDLTTNSQVLVKNGATTVATLTLGQYSVTQAHTGGNTFLFDNRGMIPSGTATPITITLTNARGATRTVTIDRLGRITNS